ncbi:MAG: rhomboid family intramembrane serine protease [Cyclobacteriaceae bacterium]|jgi:membrane associated rhomboid family serine protease|nr:rhomboid family intramembrane serine protease [Cyclobacteriaceae bacterium]
MQRTSLLGSAAIPFRLVFLMWLIFLFEISYGLNANFLGILPRSLFGFVGVLFAPLIHGDFLHLLSNTVPLLFLGTMLFYFYGKIGQTVFLRAYFWTNLCVWIFARPTYHIGASGIVYGLAFFLIFFGIFRRDFLSLLVSLVTILLYGSVFYGILPTDPSISWESHFSGAIVGIFTAVNFRNKKRVG